MKEKNNVRIEFLKPGFVIIVDDGISHNRMAVTEQELKEIALLAPFALNNQ